MPICKAQNQRFRFWQGAQDFVANFVENFVDFSPIRQSLRPGLRQSSALLGKMRIAGPKHLSARLKPKPVRVCVSPPRLLGVHLTFFPSLFLP